MSTIVAKFNNHFGSGVKVSAISGLVGQRTPTTVTDVKSSLNFIFTFCPILTTSDQSCSESVEARRDTEVESRTT